MSVRVGINGFGRIGRNVFRAAHESSADIEIVAVNDITDAETLAHLLKYDSVYGPFPGEVEATDGALVVDGREVKVLAERDPAALPWGDLGVDVVIESTGFFTKRDDAAKHLDAGAQEGDHLRAGHRAGRDRRARRQLRRRLRRRQPPRHLQRVVHDQLPRPGRQGAARPRRHRARPDDDDPRLHGRPAPAGRAAQGPAPRPRRRDQPRARLDRRGEGDRPRHPRAPGQAARLRGARARPDRLGRRPHRRTPARDTSVEEINEAFAAQADTGALHRASCSYTDDPIVSSDIVKSPFSSIFDSELTAVLDGNLVKVVAWYDNEWGYSNRCVELAAEGARACARLTTSTSRASGSSSGWTSTSRWTRTAAITDDARIRAALPTLRELREKGARLLLAAHLGRPKGREREVLAAARGRAAGRAARRGRRSSRRTSTTCPDGDVVMLENVRYEPGETKNDPELAQRYAALADVYVNDAFGAAHRAHASTEARRAPAAERRRAGCSSARSSTLQRHPRGPASGRSSRSSAARR